MTALQKQALFTLRQALALCEEAGIEIRPDADMLVLTGENEPDELRLTEADIDYFERESSDA